jgi:hypothetical protein
LLICELRRQLVQISVPNQKMLKNGNNAGTMDTYYGILCKKGGKLEYIRQIGLPLSAYKSAGLPDMCGGYSFKNKYCAAVFRIRSKLSLRLYDPTVPERNRLHHY